MPRFEAHQPTPPSSFPPASESSFVTCHALKLTNPLLPLPPLQLVSPRLCRAPFQISPTRSSLFLPTRPFLLLPSRRLLLPSGFPLFPYPPPVPPSSFPPVGESSFVTCHASKLTNPLLPLPPLQRVSPRL